MRQDKAERSGHQKRGHRLGVQGECVLAAQGEPSFLAKPAHTNTADLISNQPRTFLQEVQLTAKICVSERVEGFQAATSPTRSFQQISAEHPRLCNLKYL